MKKIIKNNLLGFILGILICSVGVYAVNNWNASQIDFTTDKNSNVKTVKDALDDLYAKTNKTITFVYQFESIETGWNSRAISNINLTNFKDIYKKVAITEVNVPSTCNSFEYKIYNSSWGNETTPVIGHKYDLTDFSIIYGYARAKTSGTGCLASLTISLSNS